MGEQLGLDSKVTALEAATDAAEWHEALVDLLRAGFLSDRNPFGALARQSLATVKIRAGMIIPWSGGTANIPDGWLLCDGRYVGRSVYRDLATRIGTTHGPYQGGDFKLPDLRRKVAIGWGGVKPAKSLGPDNRSGATGGRETATLGSATIPAHGHLLAGSATGIELVAVGSHTHQVYQFTTPRSDAGAPGNFVVRRDYLSNSTSATILDQADRHIHFLGGHTDDAGTATPAPITVSGTRLCMHWLIKT